MTLKHFVFWMEGFNSIKTMEMESWHIAVCNHLKHESMTELSVNSHLLSYGVNFCFLMGPAEFNFICSSSGLKTEHRWETNSECRKKQSTAHSPENLVSQKLCPLLQWMYPPILMYLCHAIKFLFSRLCQSLKISQDQVCLTESEPYICCLNALGQWSQTH